MDVKLAGLRRSLRFDVIAGLTIALVAIPQSMAYAAIAGAAPIHGLYASIVPTIVGALFGRRARPHMWSMSSSWPSRREPHTMMSAWRHVLALWQYCQEGGRSHDWR